VLNPGAPHVRRSEIWPSQWGQWLAAGAAGLVGFVVLALLLVFGTAISQLDHKLIRRLSASVRRNSRSSRAQLHLMPGHWRSASRPIQRATQLVLSLSEPIWPACIGPQVHRQRSERGGSP
jgi:hypothetical protein